ncbi:hypothetical protein GCM10009067_41120 [Haloarcula sebkhae]|uniref:Uncharacterized protein n=1 Tax=Haloarcula sebkhae TaxID=932660 RepID=A0A830EXM7_9EURY|nr:hypothetical protein GCM10009067_41120 [Haloarcula sebkhae]
MGKLTQGLTIGSVSFCGPGFGSATDLTQGHQPHSYRRVTSNHVLATQRTISVRFIERQYSESADYAVQK